MFQAVKQEEKKSHAESH